MNNKERIAKLLASDHNGRIGCLDAAKGIAIICIVIGHSYSYHVGNGSLLIPYLYSFHVPIFFVISGILYAQRSSIQLNIWKKIKELIIPYVFWGAVYQVCLGGLSIIGGASFQQQVSSRVSTWLQLTSGAMWFLPTMFISTVLFQISSKLNNMMFRLSFCIIAFVIGVVAPHNSVTAETLWRGLIGFSFMTIGYYGSAIFTKRVRWYVWVILLILDVVIIHYYGTANFATRSFGIIPIYLIVSLLGSWLCVVGCNGLESTHLDHKRYMLKQLGRYSIVILCTHQIILTILQIVDYRFFNYRIQKSGEFEGIIMATIIIATTRLIMPFLIRYFGWSFGFLNQEKER